MPEVGGSSSVPPVSVTRLRRTSQVLFVLAIVVVLADVLHFGLGFEVFAVTHLMYLLLPLAMIAYATLRFGIKFSVTSATLLFFGGITVEVVGTRTGFPFGSYYYTAAFQPQVLGVPIEIALGWLTLGLMCFSLASLGCRRRVFLIPLAALLMVAWDILYDPVFTGLGMWVWREGSYFTVPLSNFLGWFLASILFFYLMSLVSKRSDVLREGLAPYGPLAVYFSYLFDGAASNLSLGQGLASAVGGVAMITMAAVAVLPFVLSRPRRGI